jgi:iron complex outermembrane recepter protein
LRGLKRTGSWKRKSVLSLVAVLLLSSSGAAQSVMLEGQILDPSRAAVPNATVTLASDSGPTRNSRSDGQGRFRFDALVPGRYRVTVAREGFATVTETVSVGTEGVRTSIRLEPAGLSESVTVAGSVLPYRATDAETGTRLDAPLLEQPQSVQVVTRGIIEERQLLRLNDVAY